MQMQVKARRRFRIALCALACPVTLLGQARADFQIPQVTLARVPAIGEQIAAPKGEVRTRCMVNSAQLDPCVEATVDGTVYTVAFRQEDNKRYVATRVSTIDPKFRSTDGIRVGDAITVNGPEDVFEAPYFEVYAKSKTEWVPIVGFLGKANVAVGEKGGEMKSVQEIWLNGRAPVRLFVGGFVEQESQKTPMGTNKSKITDLTLH